MFKAYLKKELLLNWRNPQQIIAVTLFCLSILLLLHFANLPVNAQSLASFYWIQFFLGSILALSTVFLSDEESGMIIYSLTSPRGTLVFWWARFCCAILFLVISQIMPLVFCGIWFDEIIFNYFWSILAINVLVSIGFMASSLMLTMMLHRVKFSSLILPLMTIPLIVPLFLAGQELMVAILKQQSFGGWLQLVIAYDMLFVGVGILINFLID